MRRKKVSSKNIDIFCLKNSHSRFFTDRELEAYKKKIQGPAWFVALSERQIAAANQLFTALIDDGLMNQYKRTRYILWGLEIQPQPKKRDLIDSIKFARSSDLAFLWSLYNDIYRSADDFCTQKKYTHNECVILSCICHLDMLVTLRELDRIFPVKSGINIKKVPPKRPKYPHILPPKPDPPLCMYDLYKDRMYAIENESNRWFARELLIPCKTNCIVQNILQEEIRRASSSKATEEKNLCSLHQRESSKLYVLLKKIMDETESGEFSEERHKHLTTYERGIAYRMHVQFQKCEDELNANTEELEKEIICKSIIRLVIEMSFDRRYLHLCQRCEELALPVEKPIEFSEQECGLIPKKSSYDPKAVKYFQRPSCNQPLTFNYENIFSIDYLNDHGVVKNSINKILKVNKYCTMDNAISMTLRDMWRNELRKWQDRRDAEIEESQRRVCCNEIKGTRESFYSLLREGLDILKRNPKYVLAALPHSDELPILREWILNRYGLPYRDYKYVLKYGMDGRYR